MINERQFLMLTCAGSFIFGSLLWPFVPILSPLILSIAPVVLCFSFIKDSQLQYKNNVLFLAGSFGGYILIFIVLVNLMPAHEIEIEFYGESQKNSRKKPIDFVAQNLLVSSATNPKETASINNITVKATLQRTVCSSLLQPICNFIPFKFYDKEVPIKTLKTDHHKDRALTIEIADKNNSITVMEEIEEKNTEDTFKVGFLENKHLSSNGFIDIDSKEKKSVDHFINELNELAKTDGLNHPILQRIRESCTTIEAEPFCSFPTYEVKFEVINGSPEGQAIICNNNERFGNYNGLTVQLSLLEMDAFNVQGNSISLIVQSVARNERTQFYQRLCKNKNNNNKNELIRISQKDFDNLNSGIPQDKCDQIKNNKLSSFQYRGYAQIFIPELFSNNDLEEQDEINNLPKAKNTRCL